METSGLLTVLISVILLATLSVQAQVEPAIAPGDRVRISAPSAGFDRILGTVITFKPATLSVRPEDQTEVVHLALEKINKIDVSRGMRTKAYDLSLLAGLATEVNSPVHASATAGVAGMWFSSTSEDLPKGLSPGLALSLYFPGGPCLMLASVSTDTRTSTRKIHFRVLV